MTWATITITQHRTWGTTIIIPRPTWATILTADLTAAGRTTAEDLTPAVVAGIIEESLYLHFYCIELILLK